MWKVDPWDARELREVEVWSKAVLARMHDLAPRMREIRDRGRHATRDEAMVILANAAFAVVALYLSLNASRRYLLAHVDTDGPFPTDEHTDLLDRAKRGRDAVVHLDEKMARSETAELRVNGTAGVTITAPPGSHRRADVTDLIAWTEMEAAARAMIRWLGTLEAAGTSSA